MDLVSRMMRSHTAALRPEANPIQPLAMPMDDGDEVWMQIPPWAFRWRQLMLRIQVVMVHSLTGSAIVYMEKLRERIAQDALNEYKRKAGATSLTGLTQRTVPSRPNAPKPMAKGKLLAPSKAAMFPLDPHFAPMQQKISVTREGDGKEQHGSHAFGVAVDGNVVGNHRTEVLRSRR